MRGGKGDAIRNVDNPRGQVCGKKANIVQITGVPGCSADIERQKGFEDESARHPNLTVADWRE